MLHFDSSHFIKRRGFRVSRAPPHHTFPAFLDLDGTKIKVYAACIFKSKILRKPSDLTIKF